MLFFFPKAKTLVEFRQDMPDEETLEEFGLKHRAKDLCCEGGLENLNFSVEGFVSSCRHGDGRSAADKVFFFVDSRPCDLPQVRFLGNSCPFHVT